jgi:hypothetical protein
MKFSYQFLCACILAYCLYSSPVSAKIAHSASPKKHHIKQSLHTTKRHVGKVIFPWTFAPTFDLTGTVVIPYPLVIVGTTSSTYTVTTANARIVSRYGFALQTTDLYTGDQLEISGKVTSSSIEATLVRNISSHARQGIFTGTLVAHTGTTFSLLPNGGTTSSLISVVPTETTTITIDSVPGNSGRLTVGDTLLITGTTDRTGTLLSATDISASHAKHH